MKKRALTGIVCLFLLIFAHAYAENRTCSVTIMPFLNGQDEKSHGFIEETMLDLAAGETVSIDMSAVFDMYPEHTGIYGCLYAPQEVTVAAGESVVTGQGVMEFAFPGAQRCTVTGSGPVYAYFLPVQYKTLSTDKSLVSEHFDTSFLTPTAVGHSNMFMLADPQVYVFQEAIPYVDTVYKYHSMLGPIPQGYEYMDHSMGSEIFYSFISERPGLIQCDSVSREVFDTDLFHARKMARVSTGRGYELWAYPDDQASSAELFERIDQVISVSMKLADDEFLTASTDYSPIMIVILGEELRSFGAAGIAVNDVDHTKLDFHSYIFVDSASWEHDSGYLGYLFSHELGHIIQSRTLTTTQISYASWFQEGFATYFGEKVSALLGDHYSEGRHFHPSDAQALEKFAADMTFGITNVTEYRQVGFDNAEVLMLPFDNYSFGACFMYFLEEKFGTGFYKQIADSFYQHWYKGYENDFFMRCDELSYNIDQFFLLIREGLSPSVYVDFPAYMEQNYGVSLSPASN